MGGVTIPWGKPSGDNAVDHSALKGAWEKAAKVAGWPWYSCAMQSIEPILMMCPCWFGGWYIDHLEIQPQPCGEGNKLYCPQPSLDTHDFYRGWKFILPIHGTGLLLLRVSNLMRILHSDRKKAGCMITWSVLYVCVWVGVALHCCHLAPFPRASSAGSTGCGAREAHRQPQSQGGNRNNIMHLCIYIYI